MATRNRITVDSLVEELLIDRDHARRLDQPATAISATMSAARLTGLLVDRKETGQPGDFSGLQSEADVLAMVRSELGDDAAQQLSQALQQADAEPVLDLNDVDPPEAEPVPIEPSHDGSGTPN